MSDKKNLSDYNKPRTDLNKLLPANMLEGAKILEGFDDNLFNRFFTKDEVERIIGFIGSDPQNKSLLEQIVEPTDFRQANQLQPLLYNKVGNVDWFMSFVDFMNRLSRLGVDIDRFNEWGNSLQFNWIPPIDLDKLINYQDYFWASSDFNDPPQYITIKNQANWADGRLSQTLESVTSGLTSFPIVEYDEPANSIIVSGDQLAQFRLTAPAVVTGAGVNSIIVTPIALVYDNVQNTTSIEFDVSEYNIVIGVNDNFTEIASTEIDLLETNESARKIFVSGDVTEIFTHGYVFSSEDSPSKPITLWKVESSSYDLNRNQTSIVLTDDIVDFDWDRITVKPIIRSMQAEQNVISNDPFSRSQFLLFTEADMGYIIWLKNILLFSGATGLTEGTELGSNLFTDTTGGTDYLSGAYLVGDIVRISGTGFDGDYPIENIVTSDILGLEPQFFTQAAISYELIRERLLTDISSDTPLIALSVNELWYDTLNNQLRQWNGAIWVVRVQNFGYLVDLTFNAHLVDLSQNNDWTDQNKWIHRNEIISFTGAARAQHPIIEYFPYVKLSEHSFANKEWRYRRDNLVSYASTRTEPTLFELIDTRITTGGLEIAFQDATTIIFDDKFGNLTPYLTAGTVIQLGDFGVNTGEAVVVSSEFIQLTPTDRFRTRMVIEDPVVDPLFVPEDAFIAPKLTSEGDPWISFEVNHWQFEGIEDIAASSITPIRNPMLDVIVSSTLNGSTEEILGLAFQEFKLVDGTPSVFGPTYTLDNSLHDMCLFEDFQEGDIRVYRNGERQYGNFADEPSLIDPNFTGGIIFSSDVEITDIDIIRIEVGEYALDEIGKRAVSISTSAGIEVFNLVDNRRIEQEKTERSQYPWFNIHDVNNNPLIIASNLFRYKDDPDGTFLLDLDQRVTFDETTQDYTLEQDLIDENTGELYVYFDGRELNNEFQSIWKKGLFNEQYTPVEENGFWEIPNQLYFNVEHKNRNEIKLTEIFPHFNSIIEEQTAPGINRNRFSNVYHLDCTPNHGLGGRIKEHNDGFDTLLSAMFVNNVNPLDLISFANARYDGAQVTLFEIFEDNVVSFFTETVDQNDLPIDDVEGLINFIVEEIKDIYEKNDRLDQWFGDSTTHDEITKDGVKNWVATTPFFGLSPKIRPHIINENNSTFIQVIHHDGHRKDIELNAGIETSIFNQVLSGTNSDEQTVTTEAAPFPVTINGDPVASGDYLVRTNTTAITRKLYRFSTLNVWEEINISLLYAEIILHIENALYDILSDDLLPENFVSNYDFSLVQSDVDYSVKIQEQFSVYISKNNIAAPFLNTQYQQNNPFTWNYGFTNIQTDPITGLVNTTVFSAWQALYESVFGTPYPHLEPWILQGYSIKPAGWDAEYLDFTETRKWLLLMWTNILAGIVPLGQNAPNGDAGTGLPNQITELFTYLPVNVEATATSDGYEPDALIPPYWNSDNSPNPAVRSLHDASLQEFIITPSAGFQFGQMGPDEWDWTVSSNKLYDNMIVAFKIQPLKFTNQTFGPELIDVACLQVDDRINKVASHENIFFHGDIKDDNTVFKANGLNQWYVHFNRYNGFDGVSSEFRQMWREWEAPLTYQFAAFIDTQNFKISSEFFDFVNRDFEILFKKTSGIRDVWLDALKTTLLSSPSRFSSEVEAGLDWTVSFNNTSPIGNPIQTFGVQNYPVLIEASNDTFKIFSFPINSADVTESFGFDTVQYSETANSEVSTELPNDATTFLADVEFDNAIIVNLVITGSTAQTFGDLVDVINDQIGVNGTAFLEDGSLVIKSNTIGGLTFCTITDAGLFSSVSSNFQGTTGNAFNPISFQKVFFLEDDVTKYFTPRSTFDIISSTNFDGTYTVASARYDIDSQLTRIEIEEEISIVDSTVDGFIEPQSGVSMPDEWVTGVGLNWNTNGTLPAPFNNTSLYYMIRISDNEFQLSTSREGALAGTGIIIPLTTGINQNYIGRTQNSFAAFNARSVEVFWKQHFVDSRVINTFPTPITISGVQNMIDFINGYRGFLSVAGFLYDDVDGTNRDSTTGRVNDWQLETEKLIEFLYGSKDTQQELQETYSLIPDFITNTFTSPNTITWVTGTRVTLSSPDGTLPLEFENAIASFIPYFVIQTATPGVLQLAGSLGQARNGVALTFSDNGTGSTILKLSPAMTLFPSIELNPHKQSIFINHETGIVSNVVQGNNLDLITDQRVYDSDNVTLFNDDLIVSRKDLRTQIELSNGRITDNTNNPATARDIGGMHIFFDGFEHVIQFNNSSISGALIYDAFLGINTLRFNLELDRQDGFTLRPNVGGSVIIDQSQVQNIESAADSLRFAYSTYKSKEGDEITQKVRDALGYDGPHDFADDIGITNKSQFIFYRGLIQKKGTNFAADAFANQLVYDELVTDEFWAYRIDHYGDAKEKIYPELQLFSTEVGRRELRLEFIPPLGSVSDASFFPIDLTDETRWFDQPDQVEKLLPRDRFYVNVKVVEKFEDVVNSPSYITRNGSFYIELSEPADAAFMSYQAIVGPPIERGFLTAGVDFIFITNTLIKFISNKNPTSVNLVDVSTLSYNFNAQNPAKIINRNTNVVVTEVPIWNPARQNYFFGAIYGVTFRRDSDPAQYGVRIIDFSPHNNRWDNRFKDKVWFDTHSEHYLPFDDSFIKPDINERMTNWGKIAPYGEIKVFQWTESDVLPEEYDDLAIIEENDGTLPVDERKTGRVRQVLFRNDGTPITPIWVEEDDIHFDFVAEIVTATTYTDKGAPLNTLVQVYIDGVAEPTQSTFATAADFKTFADGVTGVTIHVVDEKTIPTALQITDLDFKFDTPYTVIDSVDAVSGRTILTYYFWVEDRISSIPILGGPTRKTTLRTVKAGLESIPTPYMIPNNIVDISTVEYADIFSTNSPEKEITLSYEFPYTYNQVIVRGLDDFVPSEDFYTLRFTRDFSLRDRLIEPCAPDLNDLQRKNVHWEWKLFREKQLEKIDLVLWNAITESMLGFEFDGEPLSTVEAAPVPSITPSVTPTLTPFFVTPTPTSGSSPTPTPTQTVTPTVTQTVTPTVTSTINASPTPTVTPTVSNTPGIVVTVTPTLTPDVTPTQTVTPTVTPSTTIPASPLPSVTPSNTPVASPTPTPAGVNIIDHTLSGPLNLLTFVVLNDGNLSNNIAVETIIPAFGPTEWHGSNPNPGVGADFDVRMVTISGALVTTLGLSPADVWLNLTVSRAFGVLDGSFTGALEIRDAGTLVVLDTAIITITSS